MIPRVFVASLLASAAALLPGQVVSDIEDEEIIELEVFRVDSSEDSRYQVQESTSSTRIAALLKETPMNVSALTEEFIRDIGATDLKEALQYTTGITTDTLLASPIDSDFLDPQASFKNTAKVTIRGFPSSVALRNGFRRTYGADTAAMQRIEIVRGPNALLYGIGNFGGLVNYITKLPTFGEWGSSVEVSAGSDSFWRGQAEVNVPIYDDLAVKVIGVLEDSEHWTDFNTRSKAYAYASTEWRPFSGSSLVLDVEYEDFDRTGVGDQWVRQAASDSIEERFRSNIFDLPYESGEREEATFRWTGNDTFADVEYGNVRAEWTQRLFEGLTLLVGWNYSEFDYNGRLVTDFQIDDEKLGPPSLYIGRVVPILDEETGMIQEREVALRYRWENDSEVTETHQVRIELNWTFNLWGSSHNVLLGRLDQSQRSDRETFSTRGYFFQAIDDYSYLTLGPQVIDPTNSNDLRWAGLGPIPRPPFMSQDMILELDEQTKNEDQGTYLVHMGRFFDGKILTLSGVRYDRNDAYREAVEWNDEWEDTTIDYETTPGSWQASGASTKWSPLIAATWNITDQVSVFGLMSSGLFPNYNRSDGNGVPIPPTEAESREVGFKLSLFNGKMNATVSAYQIDREGHPREIWWAPAPKDGRYDPDQPLTYYLYSFRTSVTDFRDYHWAGTQPGDTRFETAIDPATGDYVRDPETGLIDYVNGGGVFVDDRVMIQDYFENGQWMYSGETSETNNPSLDIGTDVPFDDRSQGVDVEVVLAPLEGLQLVFNYSYLDREVTNGGTFVDHPGAEAPVDIWLGREQPEGTWGAGLDSYADPLRASTYDGSFGKGERWDDSPPHSAKFWGYYEVPTGPIRGANVGLGVRWEDKRQFLAGAGVAGDTVVGEDGEPVDLRTQDRTIVDLKLGYGRQFGPVHASVNFWVFNLLDFDEKVGYSWTAPRSYRFSTRLAF